MQQKIHFQRRDRDNLGSLNSRGDAGIYQRMLMLPCNDRADDLPCAQPIAQLIAQLIAKPGIFMSKPQYLQIKDALANQILAGGLAPNDKLPSERLLGELYGTTRVTIREALVQLEANGLIYREDRRGWFVTPPRFRLNPRRTSNFHQIVREQGGEPRTELLEKSRQAVPPALMAQLQLKPFDSLFLLKRLRYANGRAICYCENHCLPERVPGLLALDLNGSLTEIYQAHYDLHYARMQVRFLPHRPAGRSGQGAGGHRRSTRPAPRATQLRSARTGARLRSGVLAPRQPGDRGGYPGLVTDKSGTAKRHGAVTVTS